MTRPNPAMTRRVMVNLYMDAHKGEAEQLTLAEFFETWINDPERQVAIVKDLIADKMHYGRGFGGLFKLVAAGTKA